MAENAVIEAGGDAISGLSEPDREFVLQQLRRVFAGVGNGHCKGRKAAKIEVMEALEDDHFWDEFPQSHRDPETRGGALILQGSRLTPDDLVGNVEAFMELEGLGEDEAIEATLKQFPSTPGGADTIRKLLTYQEAHLHQLQP